MFLSEMGYSELVQRLSFGDQATKAMIDPALLPRVPFVVVVSGNGNKFAIATHRSLCHPRKI